MILPILLLLLIGYEFGMGILMLLIAACIIILFFRLDIPQLSFLGEISYSLYLTHFLVLIVLLRLFSKAGINLNKHQLLWLILEVSIAVLLAYFFNQIIERPAQYLSKKLAYKKALTDGDH
jgi:peptidoglycan/LPS O-acetylase OafA/YrhL